MRDRPETRLKDGNLVPVAMNPHPIQGWPSSGPEWTLTAAFLASAITVVMLDFDPFAILAFLLGFIGMMTMDI